MYFYFKTQERFMINKIILETNIAPQDKRITQMFFCIEYSK